MARGNKHERHKARREAKRKQARRRDAVGPLRLLAKSPGEMECWTTDHFGAERQWQAFVYKRAAGLSGIACFLVDQGVVGLKDAWTRMEIDRSEFREMLHKCNRNGIPMRPGTVDEVRRMVAGGIRWAYENGMRLPKDWVKTASLIGGVDDWKTADVSQFVKEFVGHPEDLRQRLIPERFDDYLKRTDIQFVFSESAPYMDQETGMYFEDDEPDEENLESAVEELPNKEIDALSERLTPVAVKLAEDTAASLAARGDSPSPGLAEAWRSLLLARLISKAALPDAPEAEVDDVAYVLLDKLSARIEESREAEYERAVDQALDHLATDRPMMQRAILKYLD